MLFFAFNIILCSILLILAKNPIHSVLYLIYCFLNGAGFILYLGLEFLAVIFIVIYVGAIAVLFLFVVMMLDIKFLEINESFLKYLPISFFLTLIFSIELLFSFSSFYFSINSQKDKTTLFSGRGLSYDESLWTIFLQSGFYKNVQHFSSVLYVDFFYIFWCAGLLLLLAMVGAIILTLNKNIFIKRQSIYDQINRDPNSIIEVRWNSLYFDTK